jgi:Cu(I)/Ag(I) efflux system membrane fusion protein
MGCFNVMQGQSTLIKMNQPIRFSSEFDQNDFINAKVDFIETQLSETDKTNRIRVYLNNSNLKFRLDCVQGIIETNPFRVFGFRALVSIGSKKVVLSKKKMVLKQEK